MQINIQNDFQYIPLNDWNKYFYTFDFDLSVTLVCKKCELVTIEPELNGKLVFVFKNCAEIKELVNGYWGNRITVNPLDFAHTRKNLKSRIFGLKKNYK